MASATLSHTEQEAKSAARGQVREMLSRSAAFATMPVPDQHSLYLSLVQDEYHKELRRRGVPAGNGGGLARSLATDSGADMGYKGYDPAFQGDTQSFKDLVQSVDFPKFVADLLKAVFDANLTVMKTQTDAYIKLMKEATKSSAEFIKKVKDEESFAKLAESKGDKYNVISEKQADGSQKLALTNPQGEKHDVEDAEVKKDILEAKINMAKEHRAALREVLLMGVTRLVVNKGVIEAGVDFEMHATRASTAHHDDQNINTVQVDTEFGGGLGALFGGPSGSLSMTNTNIQVNTSDKKATDDLSAKLHGKVNIEFKTDYFKLDNFANMYADGGVAALKPAGAPGAAPTALPAGR
ncbi:MAG: hypothetical protein ACYDHH_00175 [Solirubrobacteraceae bacterium]